LRSAELLCSRAALLAALLAALKLLCLRTTLLPALELLCLRTALLPALELLCLRTALLPALKLLCSPAPRALLSSRTKLRAALELLFSAAALPAALLPWAFRLGVGFGHQRSGQQYSQQSGGVSMCIHV
jgi:hypothetical protein